jgi:hypothetical protein
MVSRAGLASLRRPHDFPYPTNGDAPPDRGEATVNSPKSLRALATPRSRSAATAHREMVAFRRRVKRLIVYAGRSGWITAQQARIAIRTLGLLHE